MQVTLEPGEEEFSAICPYVGLADDADSHATYATDAHRCYRLPNPTRVALGHQETYCLEANHTACPVFRGEGVQRTQPAAVAAAPSKGRERASAGRTQPLGGSAPRRTPSGTSTGAPLRPRRDRPSAALNPRPRVGGISMPVATIGLFAMAVVVILLAILIQQAVGGGGGNSSKISAADVVATNAALKGQSTRPATTPVATGSPGIGTPNPGQTPGAGTPSATQSGTAASTSKTYTVKSGDTCAAIATATNITLQQLLDANKMTEGDCGALQIGQVLKLP